jgi:hypothetical protein
MQASPVQVNAQWRQCEADKKSRGRLRQPAGQTGATNGPERPDASPDFSRA